MKILKDLTNHLNNRDMKNYIVLLPKYNFDRSKADDINNKTFISVDEVQLQLDRNAEFMTIGYFTSMLNANKIQLKNYWFANISAN